MRERDLPVLQTWAEALIEAAGGPEAADAFSDEARELLGFLRDNPRALRLLERPAIGNADKKAFVRKVFEGRLSPLMLNLPLLLIDKYRGAFWDEILETFLRRLEEHKGIHLARVVTAAPLANEQRERLRGCLEQYTRQKLSVDFATDPALIGGVHFRYGDLLIDNTLRGGLERLREHLGQVRIDRAATR